jgi:hypothetical protein
MVNAGSPVLSFSARATRHQVSMKKVRRAARNGSRQHAEAERRPRCMGLLDESPYADSQIRRKPARHGFPRVDRIIHHVPWLHHRVMMIVIHAEVASTGPPSLKMRCDYKLNRALPTRTTGRESQIVIHFDLLRAQPSPASHYNTSVFFRRL